MSWRPTRSPDPFLEQLPSALAVRWGEAVRGSPLEDAFRFILRVIGDTPGSYRRSSRLGSAQP